MAKNTPAFQFYPQDFLGGVMLMDNETVGVYIKLLSVLWISNNSLPLEFTQLSRATHCDSPEKFLEAWSHIADKFEIAGNTVSHPRFTNMIELREKRKASGSLGGTTRVANTYKQTPSKRQANAKQNPSKVMKNEVRSLKDEDRGLETRVSVPDFARPTPEEVRRYAAEKQLNLDHHAFVDFYASKGWKVGASAMKDWKACARNWSRRNASDTATVRPQDVPRSVRMEQSSIEMANSLIAKQEQSCTQQRIEGSQQ
jgi:uncharacterized protein YdaU (DUF1376 family)